MSPKLFLMLFENLKKFFDRDDVSNELGDFYFGKDTVLHFANAVKSIRLAASAVLFFKEKIMSDSEVIEITSFRNSNTGRHFLSYQEGKFVEVECSYCGRFGEPRTSCKGCGASLGNPEIAKERIYFDT